MFTPITHPYVGTEKTYLPQGKTPYAPQAITSQTVLANGDRVTVLSAWYRPYLPADAPILLYVRSHNTGQMMHVVQGDLKGRV